MSPKPIGLWIGLFLGLVFAVGGLGNVIFAAIFGAIGFVVEKLIAGEIDVSDYIGNRDS